MSIFLHFINSWRTNKSSWPELVWVQGEVAVETIERENPSLNAIIVPEGSSVITNVDCSRVWVWVNAQNIVKKTPVVG
ncbi:hypothetical protein UlMin_009870 [Ulmus minor]